MNDTVAQERLTRRVGFDLFGPPFPWPPTSIFRREIAVALPVVFVFLALLVASCLLAIAGVGEGFERTWARGWRFFWGWVWSEIGILGVFSVGVTVGMSISRYGRNEMIRWLPVSGNRVVLEKILGSLLVLAVWLVFHRLLPLGATWLHGDGDWARISTGRSVGLILLPPAVRGFWPYAMAAAIGAWMGRRPFLCVVLVYVLFQAMTVGLYYVLRAILFVETFQEIPNAAYILTQFALGLLAFTVFAHRYHTCEAPPS
jgi:hypothetical protein